MAIIPGEVYSRSCPRRRMTPNRTPRAEWIENPGAGAGRAASAANGGGMRRRTLVAGGASSTSALLARHAEAADATIARAVRGLRSPPTTSTLSPRCSPKTTSITKSSAAAPPPPQGVKAQGGDGRLLRRAAESDARSQGVDPDDGRRKPTRSRRASSTRARRTGRTMASSRPESGSGSPPATSSESRTGQIVEHWGMGDIAGIVAQLNG